MNTLIEHMVKMISTKLILSSSYLLFLSLFLSVFKKWRNFTSYATVYGKICIDSPYYIHYVRRVPTFKTKRQLYVSRIKFSKYCSYTCTLIMNWYDFYSFMGGLSVVMLISMYTFSVLSISLDSGSVDSYTESIWRLFLERKNRYYYFLLHLLEYLFHQQSHAYVKIC
jgi:hypothetical protein